MIWKKKQMAAGALAAAEVAVSAASPPEALWHAHTPLVRTGIAAAPREEPTVAFPGADAGPNPPSTKQEEEGAK